MDIFFISFVLIPGSGAAGSYGDSVSQFEELPDGFLEWLHHFTFPPAVFEGSTLHSHPHLPLSIFVNIAILGDVKWYFMVMLVCISLMADLPLAITITEMSTQ